MKTPKQLTHNQRRKRDYKALAGQSAKDASRSAKRARLKRLRAGRKVGTRGAHWRPCGNPACAECYPAQVQRAAVL